MAGACACVPRACIAQLVPDMLPLPPVGYLALGVVVPELLPTIAALVVLRRRPIACARWFEEGQRLSGLGGCCGCCVGVALAAWEEAARALPMATSAMAGMLPCGKQGRGEGALSWCRACFGARHVEGVDRTPLREAEAP